MKINDLLLRSLGFGLLAILLILGFDLNTGEAGARQEQEKAEILVGFEKSPGPAEHRLIRSQGGEVTKELDQIEVLQVEIPARAAERVSDALEKASSVSFVEENGPMKAHAQTTPWGIDRVFGDGSYPFPTWESSTGKGVGVAVLDTGIDIRHKDLAVTGGYAAINCFPAGHCARPWDDDNGHGTHVAGTVAALDNDQGVVGIAPEAELYAVKVLDGDGAGSWATVADGITWAARNNIEIINLSLGGGHSNTVKEAVEYAADQGTLMIASAGNSGPSEDSVNYPAAYPEVMAVTATDKNNELADFSSRGSEVELAAPGVSIYSTLADNSYDTYSGTSMASPHVAGIAALAWSVDPTLISTEVREVLNSTAKNIGLSSNQQGHGLVRADRAVDSLDNGDGDEGNVEISIETLEAAEISTSSAKLGGELLDIKNTKEVSVYFRWQEEAGETWHETATRTLSEPSKFYAIIDGLQSNTRYNFKAAAEAEEVVEEGQLLALTTATEDNNDDEEVISAPRIESLTYKERTTGPWSRVDASWSVSHEDGELNWVETELLDGEGNSLDSHTTSLDRETAEGTDNLKTREAPERLKITVRAGGRVTTEKQDL